MPQKRLLSLWFPRLAAERVMRLDRELAGRPLAVADRRGAQVLVSLNAEASRANRPRPAAARCPGDLSRLVSRPENPLANTFLTRLRRWAGKFTPGSPRNRPAGWCSTSPAARICSAAKAGRGDRARPRRARAHRRTLGLADTVGAAWALARYAGHGPERGAGGDAIDQEARATRSRAAKRRHLARGGQPRDRLRPGGCRCGISHPWAGRAPRWRSCRWRRCGSSPTWSRARAAGAETDRRHPRRTPRAGLPAGSAPSAGAPARPGAGVEPEPVSPARPPLRFAVRLGLPEPIGLESDLVAALDRLLPELSARLERAGRGARRVRAEFSRTDHTLQAIEVESPAPPPSPTGSARCWRSSSAMSTRASASISCGSPCRCTNQSTRCSTAATWRRARRRGVLRSEIDDLLGRIGAAGA
ncbi:MAG: DNA polymerase Y family protein [Paracoccaceae bacterium]